MSQIYSKRVVSLKNKKAIRFFQFICYFLSEEINIIQMKLTMTRMLKDIVVDRKLHFIKYSESVRVCNR